MSMARAKGAGQPVRECRAVCPVAGTFLVLRCTVTVLTLHPPWGCPSEPWEGDGSFQHSCLAMQLCSAYVCPASRQSIAGVRLDVLWSLVHSPIIHHLQEDLAHLAKCMQVVQGPKATLRKLPSRHEGRLTAAALAGLGGNEEEVDPRGALLHGCCLV